MNASSCRASFASRNPSTSLEYSSLSLSASLTLISAILTSRLVAPRVALRRESSVMSVLRDSMQTLSILCASSKTTMQSFESSFDTLSAIFGSRR